MYLSWLTRSMLIILIAFDYIESRRVDDLFEGDDRVKIVAKRKTAVAAAKKIDAVVVATKAATKAATKTAAPKAGTSTGGDTTKRSQKETGKIVEVVKATKRKSTAEKGMYTT
jgi:hypothetical protein